MWKPNNNFTDRLPRESSSMSPTDITSSVACGSLNSRKQFYNIELEVDPAYHVTWLGFNTLNGCLEKEATLGNSQPLRTWRLVSSEMPRRSCLIVFMPYCRCYFVLPCFDVPLVCDASPYIRAPCEDDHMLPARMMGNPLWSRKFWG